jgi:hypothetical protein
MEVVLLECGCRLEGAEAQAAAELAEGLKMMCPNCRVSMRVTQVWKYWPDGEPVTPWADPWHDVIEDIRQFKADAYEHRDDPDWPQPYVPRGYITPEDTAEAFRRHGDLPSRCVCAIAIVRLRGTRCPRCGGMIPW